MAFSFCLSLSGHANWVWILYLAVAIHKTCRSSGFLRSLFLQNLHPKANFGLGKELEEKTKDPVGLVSLGSQTKDVYLSLILHIIDQAECIHWCISIVGKLNYRADQESKTVPLLPCDSSGFIVFQKCGCHCSVICSCVLGSCFLFATVSSQVILRDGIITCINIYIILFAKVLYCAVFCL